MSKKKSRSLADLIDNKLAKAIRQIEAGKKTKSSPFTHKWKSKLGTAECDDVFWSFLHSN